MKTFWVLWDQQQQQSAAPGMPRKRLLKRFCVRMGGTTVGVLYSLPTFGACRVQGGDATQYRLEFSTKA